MQAGEWDAAYVLHRRPYRSTSYIMDLWTEQGGRISVVAKSSRGNKSRFRGQLEPFTRLLVTWRGKGELKTLTQAEVSGMPVDLQGEAIWCGFYLNELLLRLFRAESPHPIIFTAYESALRELKQGDVQTALRHFECLLLQDLGYALPLDHDDAGSPIVAEHHYRFFPETGFTRCEENNNPFIFSGAVLRVLHTGEAIPKVLQPEAKRLLRIALQPLLGDKPLKSREFFAAAVS